MRGVCGAWPRWTGFCVAVVCVAVVCALGSTALGQAQVPPSVGGVVTPPAARQSANPWNADPRQSPSASRRRSAAAR